MKTTVTFEYDTDNPDHRQEIARLHKSSDMAIVLFELVHNLYSRTEHKTRVETIEWVHQLINDYNLSNTEEYIS